MTRGSFIIILALIFMTVFIAVYIFLNSLNYNPEKEDDRHLYIGPYDFTLLNRDGYYTYEDDSYRSMAGIDVSEHNGTVDFTKVRADGIDFVYLRIGWRGYTEGLIHEDTAFRKYYSDAVNSGLKVGVYFFSQALNEKEAIEEADTVRRLLEQYPVDLPVVYDFEYIDSDDARTDGIDREQCTANALAFMKALENEHEVMFYANCVLIKDFYDMDKLADYRLWYAQYNELPESGQDFFIWQYSNKGKVDGCEKAVDLNIMFIGK